MTTKVRALDRVEFNETEAFIDNTDKARLPVSGVVAAFAKVKNQPASQIAHFYAHVKRLTEQMSDQLSELNTLKAYVQEVALPQAFELEGVTTVSLADGSRVTVQQTVRASIKADKKEEAIAWLEKNGMDEVPQVTVNASTLAAVARNVLKAETGFEAGEDENTGEVRRVFDLPPSLFNIDLAPHVSVTKAKSKS